MEADLTRRQQLAWCFGALGVPAMLLCASAAWQWVLLAGALAALYYIIVWRLWVRAGQKPLPVLARDAFGGVGRGILIAAALWTLTALGDTARRSAAAFPESREGLLCGVVLLILCAASGTRGVRASARAAAVLAPVLAVIHAVLLLTALGQVKLTWCAPWGEASQLFTLFPALLLPSAALCLPRTPDGGRLPWAMLAVLALAPAAFAVVTSGCLSPQVAQADALPFYTLAKSLSLLSVMERLEPLASAVLYLSFFALAALLTQSCAALFCGGLRRSDAPRWLAPGICALALAFGWLACPLPGWLSGGGAAVFWGALPLLTLLVVAVKKDRKKQK